MNTPASLRLWNEKQKALRAALDRPIAIISALELFLSQHAVLHSAKVSSGLAWSYEDEILNDITEEQFRGILQTGEHSVAWCIWHMARIEDVTMNILIAGRKPVLDKSWQKQLNLNTRDTGNAMEANEIVHLSVSVNLETLRTYRVAVGKRTREIVQSISREALKQKVETYRIDQVIADGAVTEKSHWLLDYWSGLSIAGLLLMPPTRHNLVHLNEAARIKQKRRK